jgi:hypothetical protein
VISDIVHVWRNETPSWRRRNIAGGILDRSVRQHHASVGEVQLRIADLRHRGFVSLL